MFIGLVIELLITIRVFPKTTSSLTHRYTYAVLQIIHMNLLFFFICADRAVFGTTETAQEKLKCTTFEASYFMFSGAKTVFFIQAT